MKRQAYEVIAEIEKKWRQRSGVMMWSWQVSHLAFLIERWTFKNPGDEEQRLNMIRMMQESIAARQRACINYTWIYMHKEHIRQMMVGACLDTREPVRVSKVTDNSVIELRRRQIQTVG